MKAGLGAGALALVCCGGLPIALGVAAAAGTAGLIGGVIALGVVAGIGLAVLLIRGARRRNSLACPPSGRELRSQNGRASADPGLGSRSEGVLRRSPPVLEQEDLRRQT